MRSLFLGLVFVCPLAIQSGSRTAQREDAQAVARSLEAHYKSAKTLRAPFLERYREGDKDARVESGTVYFSRPGRMRWEYESPEEKLFLVDGKTVWFYVPADRTVTRAPLKQSADWRTPLARLTGQVKLARLCGSIEFASEPAAAAGHVLLQCLPHGEGSRARSRESADPLSPGEDGESFREVLLEVDSGRSELAGVRIRQAGSVEIDYRFGNWHSNLPLPKGMFRFQAPAGVAIVDESSLRGPAH